MLRYHRFTRPLSKITKAGTFVDPEVQNAKSSSQWQPPVDDNDQGGDSDGGGDFADACFENSDDECAEAAAPQEQRPQAVGLQLVDAPKMAQRLDIGFARKAKRVDVKALKENLWSNLAPDGKKSSSTTFTSEVSHLSRLLHVGHTLAGIMSKVPVASDAKFADVSVPYCFICLLHLCNEKSLKLVRAADFDYFVVASLKLSATGRKCLVYTAQNLTRLMSKEAGIFITRIYLIQLEIKDGIGWRDLA